MRQLDPDWTRTLVRFFGCMQPMSMTSLSKFGWRCGKNVGSCWPREQNDPSCDKTKPPKDSPKLSRTLADQQGFQLQALSLPPASSPRFFIELTSLRSTRAGREWAAHSHKNPRTPVLPRLGLDPRGFSHGSRPRPRPPRHGSAIRARAVLRPSFRARSARQGRAPPEAFNDSAPSQVSQSSELSQTQPWSASQNAAAAV